MSDLFRQIVLPLFEADRADWLTQARAAARSLGADGDTVTVNAVRALCPPPDRVDPRVLGAVFAGREWINVGYGCNPRRTCHGRPLARFRLRKFVTEDASCCK